MPHKHEVSPLHAEPSGMEDMPLQFEEGQDLLCPDFGECGKSEAMDQVLLDRLLTSRVHEADYAAHAPSLVRQAIERKEARREGWLLAIAQVLQVVVLLSSAFMILFNYHVFSIHYASATPLDQTRMTLSLVMTFLSAFLCVGAPYIAKLESRIRMWFTGARKAPTSVNILLLRFQALGLLVLTLVLIR